ncbi:hypothetical protein J0910_10765 [Nocardiopsis sp. CNT-189]|uniref:hypothetical protein n=1 Tax=Nocardiopsis oceanisediminis TaxID=2816862 RepID=UPI003B2C99F3
MDPAGRALRVAAAVELGSLAVLLANLATLHLPGVASLAGPVHGCAYLFVIGAAARHPHRRPAALLQALVPGIGGLLAVRTLGRARPPEPAPGG